jgi:hypothetical protein
VELEALRILISSLPPVLAIWVVVGLLAFVGALSVLRVGFHLRHGVTTVFPPDR